MSGRIAIIKLDHKIKWKQIKEHKGFWCGKYL